VQRLSSQNQGAQRQFSAHVAEAEEDPTVPKEVSSLVVDPRGPADKNVHKAPGNYPYPFATNRLKNAPPRPCRNCGSTVHYDHDCDSWRKQGKANARKLPVNAANSAYEEVYITILQGDEEACSTHCDTYYAMVDTITMVESLVVGTTSAPEPDTLEKDVLFISDTPLTDDPVIEKGDESSWMTLEVNMAEKETQASLPFEDVYLPKPIW